MQNRSQEKKALIVFNPEFESAARAFVEETLQYRELYSTFYLLPVSPNEKDNNEFSSDKLDELLTNEGITRTNTDSYLVRKKGATKWAEEAGDERYTDAVLQCVKKFRKHFVAVTYDYYKGEKKFSTLKRFRQHEKYTTDQGFPAPTVSQVPLLGRSNKAVKTDFLAGSFFNLEAAHENPPYKYLLLPGAHLPEGVSQTNFDESAIGKYQQFIAKAMALREEKVVPILRAMENNYDDPESVAEKLANLFHAYAARDYLSSYRSHRELAKTIASTLYHNPDWELEECLHFIKSKVNHSRQIIDPRGTFQGVLLEILNMMHSISILQVGEQLEEYWQDKYDELTALKDSMNDSESKVCLGKILQELKTLEESGKPYAVLLRAIDSTVSVVQHPSIDNYKKQYQVAQDIGRHSWGRVLGGLSLCLLGLGLGVGIGLAVYLTGGAGLLLAAPVVMHGVVLSASLVNAGLAAIAGATAASAPLLGSGFCLFGKQSISKHMEELAELSFRSSN